MCLLRGTDWVFIYNSTFCPHSVFMCSVWIWERTAIISLYSINWLVFITELFLLLSNTKFLCYSVCQNYCNSIRSTTPVLVPPFSPLLMLHYFHPLGVITKVLGFGALVFASLAVLLWAHFVCRSSGFHRSLPAVLCQSSSNTSGVPAYCPDTSSVLAVYEWSHSLSERLEEEKIGTVGRASSG